MFNYVILLSKKCDNVIGGSILVFKYWLRFVVKLFMTYSKVSEICAHFTAKALQNLQLFTKRSRVRHFFCKGAKCME